MPDGSFQEEYDGLKPQRNCFLFLNCRRFIEKKEEIVFYFEYDRLQTKHFFTFYKIVFTFLQWCEGINSYSYAFSFRFIFHRNVSTN